MFTYHLVSRCFKGLVILFLDVYEHFQCSYWAIAASKCCHDNKTYVNDDPVLFSFSKLFHIFFNRGELQIKNHGCVFRVQPGGYLPSAGRAAARGASKPADSERRRTEPRHSLACLNAALWSQTHPWCTTQEPCPLQTRHTTTHILAAL